MSGDNEKIGNNGQEEKLVFTVKKSGHTYKIEIGREVPLECISHGLHMLGLHYDNLLVGLAQKPKEEPKAEPKSNIVLPDHLIDKLGFRK